MSRTLNVVFHSRSAHARCSPSHRTRTARIAAVLLLLFILSPLPAGAQTAECVSTDCGGTQPEAVNRLWVEASAVHALKLEFVEFLQRFVRAQAGTFGDEGDELRAGLDGMRDALTRWDAAIEQFQARAVRVPGAAAHLALATVYLDRHRVDDALRALAAAQRENGDLAEVPLLQALAYGDAGRTSDAVRALRNAVAIDPANPVTFYALARSLAALGQENEAARAQQDLERALRRQAAATRAPAQQAPRFERIGLLRQAADVAPIFPQARYAEGLAALNTGDYAAAVARLIAASADDPLIGGDPAAHRHVAGATAVLKQGRIDLASEQLQAAVVAMPNEPEVRRALGLVFWIDGQLGPAIEHLRSAIRLGPGDERARLMLADVLAEDRRFAEAERELEQATAAGLRSGQIHYRLADLYERQSLLPQAAKAFRDSEAFGPIVGRDRFYFALGRLLVNQADFDGAIAAYARRIEANPNSGEAHRQLGEVYFLQGRDRDALSEFLIARWLDPKDARSFAAAGQVHVRLLEYAEAVADLERALALDPRLREARYALGTSLARVGRTDEAKQQLELFQQQQAEVEALGQRDFQVDALRREAARLSLGGDHAKAVDLLQQASALDPQSARGQRDLGLALLRLQRSTEAIDHLAAAQRLEETAEGYAYLADAYTAAGDREEALRQRARFQALRLQAKLDRIRDLAR